MNITKNSIILKSKEKPIKRYWLFVFGLAKVVPKLRDYISIESN